MRGFFGRWLLRSLRRSLAAGLVGTASLALAATLVFALVAVSAGVEQNLGAELRAYGANLLVLPRLAPLRFGLGAYELGAVEEERTLAEAELADLPPEVAETVAPCLVVRASAAGQPVGLLGCDPAALRRLHPRWRVTPAWPSGGAEAVVGTTLAGRLGLAPGKAVALRLGERSALVEVAATLETGGPEDEAMLVPLALAQGLAGLPGQASFALVRGPAGGDLEAAARALEAARPAIEVRTLRQVARAEAALLGTVRKLLALVAVALAAAAAFTVTGTLGVLLLARRREIGLCLALGASPAEVARLLLAEAALSGAAAGLAGCALGAGATQLVARSLFGAFVPVHPAAAPLALAAALLLSLGAAAWPVRRAVRTSPCDSLRAA